MHNLVAGCTRHPSSETEIIRVRPAGKKGSYDKRMGISIINNRYLFLTVKQVVRKIEEYYHRNKHWFGVPDESDWPVGTSLYDAVEVLD